MVLPVIERELRACARQPFTYYLRAVGMTALLVECLLFGMNHGFGPTSGNKLFGSLHLTLFGAIWILVPLLTADCISRERREGTLGLLFLTRLSATDIVTAKSLAHGLRALTLWLAALPVLTIPFLLGGVSWIEGLVSVAISFSAICWGLAAGLLASAWSKSWMRSMLAAGILSFFLLFVFGMLVGQTMVQGARGFSGTWQTSSDFVFLSGFALIGGGTGFTRLFRISNGQLLWSISLLGSFSVLILLLAIVLAGQKTRRVWQAGPPSRLQAWLQATFCTPIFWLGFFRRWMLRQIERNPIGWLERRSWSGRLVTWGWFAVVISFYTAALGDRNFFRGLDRVQNAMAWLLAGSLAVSAAGSFRRERETGVLELLLVSPLKEGDIMFGRLRGLWGQFMPAFGMLFALWIFFENLFPGRSSAGPIIFHLSTFLSLPLIGLYYSLRCRNFPAAFIMTLGAGLFVPVALGATLYPEPRRFGGELRLYDSAVCFQLIFAFLCGVKLYHRLKHRAFEFNHESK